MAQFEVGTFTTGTLIGIVLGAFIGHALAIRRGKFQARHNAAIVFRQALMPAIIKIEAAENAISVISASFEDHYASAISYSAYLSGNKLSNFKKELAAYKKWHSVMCNRDKAQILYGENEPEFVNMSKINPLSLLKKILGHANT